MLEERVAETLERGAGKPLGIAHPVGDHRNDFLEEQTLQPRADLGMLHALAHGVQAARTGESHQSGVRSVKDADLAQIIRGQIGGQADRGMREKRLPARGLDAPEREGLGAQEQGIDGLQRMLGRRTRHDAVHQIVEPLAGVSQPIDDHRRRLPARGLGQHEVAQLAPVLLDELAGHDGRGGKTGCMALEQNVEQLGGKAVRRPGLHRTLDVALIEREARLGGVGEHPAQRGFFRHGEDLAPLRARVQRARDRIDLLHPIDHAAPGKTPDGDVIAAVRRVQRVGAIPVGGLDDDDAAGRGRVVAIRLRDEKIGEGPEEIAGAKLKNGFLHKIEKIRGPGRPATGKAKPGSARTAACQRGFCACLERPDGWEKARASRRPSRW